MPLVSDVIIFWSSVVEFTSNGQFLGVMTLAFGERRD